MDTRKFAALTITAAVASIAVLLAVFNHYRPPLESLPLDFGWLGFAFIFANGFLLSCIIVNKKSGVLDRLLLTVGLGFGLTFLVMVLVGVLWQITLLNVLAIEVALLAVLGVLALRRGLKPPHLVLERTNLQLKKHNILQAVLIAIIGVLAFASVYNALAYPPTEWDSMAYGVNYARIIYQNSHIPLIAGSSIGIEMSAPYPPGMQLSATFLYTFAGSANDFYYRILSPIFSLATLLVVYKFTRELTKNRTAAVFAASALSLIPYFWQLFIQDTYLMSLTFMLTMTGYFFCKAYTTTSEPRNYEVLGTLFCSFAALASYIGLLAFGIPLLYTLHKRTGFTRLASYLGLGALVALPWYLRNLVLLENPFFPFLGGKYLDPLLHNSTSQSFQQYLQIPEFAIMSTLCKIAAVLLVAGIVLFTLSKKRRDFPLALTLYCLLIGISLMAVYVAFFRYLIVALPTAAVFFGFAMSIAPKNRLSSAELSFLPSKLKSSKAKLLNALQYRRVYAAFIVLIVLVSGVMLPYVNSVKPLAGENKNRTEYIASVFEEGGAWRWINQYTPADTKIATFDIKGYYLNRTMFSLDSNAAAPIYKITNIDEAINFLADNGVEYFLSAPWATPSDPRMPQAYNWCIITQYLGDLNYLPPVYVDNSTLDSGAAVYHVGALDASFVKELFAEGNSDYLKTVPPLMEQTISLTISNLKNPRLAACYLPVPVDYRARYYITASVDYNSTIDLELYNGKIPEVELEHPNPKINYMIWNSPLDDNFNTNHSAFTWGHPIDNVGYFTIRLLNRNENITQPISVTLTIQLTKV